MLFAWHDFDSVGTLFHALILVFIAAMVGFCVSSDIFTLFVCLELMGVAASEKGSRRLRGSLREARVLLIPIQPRQQIKDQRQKPEERDADEDEKREFHEACLSSARMRS